MDSLPMVEPHLELLVLCGTPNKSVSSGLSRNGASGMLHALHYYIKCALSQPARCATPFCSVCPDCTLSNAALSNCIATGQLQISSSGATRLANALQHCVALRYIDLSCEGSTHAHKHAVYQV